MIEYPDFIRLTLFFITDRFVAFFIYDHPRKLILELFNRKAAFCELFH